jgi:hypothetical protein
MNFTTIEIVLGLVAWIVLMPLALNAWDSVVDWVHPTCPYCGERHR